MELHQHIHEQLQQGLKAYEGGRLKEAEGVFEAILAQAPHLAEVWFLLGDSAQQSGDLIRAEEAYRRCLSMDAACYPAMINLAQVYQARGRWTDAEKLSQQAYNSCPEDLSAGLTYGGVLFGQERYNEAAQVFEGLLRACPDVPDVIQNWGMALEAAGRLEEAEGVLSSGTQAFPHHALLHFHLSTVLLGQQHFEAGWAEYQWRFQTDMVYDRLAQLRAVEDLVPADWQGEPLAGKTILVLAEQGYGDVIQFSRWVPELVKLGADVTFEVHPGLTALLSSQSHMGRVVERQPGGSMPTGLFDFAVPLMSVARGLGIHDTSQIHGAPYLKMSTGKPFVGRETLRRIGVVWAGSPTNQSGQRRSIPLTLFQQLFSRPDLSFLALSPSISQAEQTLLSSWENVTWVGNGVTDFQQTAQWLAQCDAVVTVDTAVAHLAGALGIPTTVLLPYASDWRWFSPPAGQASPTPWYDSVTLMRQPTPGDWAGVLEKVLPF